MSEPTYRLPDAAKAAGYTKRKYRWRIEGGFFPTRGCDRTPNGSGSAAGYSRRHILHAATTKCLTDLGLSISVASDAALKFSDEGQTSRAPGETFAHGKSILTIGPDGATVRNFRFDAAFADVSNRGRCIIAVDLNRVADDVDAALMKVQND